MVSSHWWSSLTIGAAKLLRQFPSCTGLHSLLLCFSFSQMGLYCVVFNCWWTRPESKIVGVVKTSRFHRHHLARHKFILFTLNSSLWLFLLLFSHLAWVFVILQPLFTSHFIILSLYQQRSCRAQREEKFMPRVMTSASHSKSVILQHGNITSLTLLPSSEVLSQQNEKYFLC